MEWWFSIWNLNKTHILKTGPCTLAVIIFTFFMSFSLGGHFNNLSKKRLYCCVAIVFALICGAGSVGGYFHFGIQGRNQGKSIYFPRKFLHSIYSFKRLCISLWKLFGQGWNTQAVSDSQQHRDVLASHYVLRAYSSGLIQVRECLGNVLVY